MPRYASKELPFAGAHRDALAVLDNKQYHAVQNQASAVILVNDVSELPNDGLASFMPTRRGISTISMPFVHIKRAIIDDIVRSSTGMSLLETEKAIDGNLQPHSAPLTGWSIDLEVKVKRKEVMVKNVIGYVEGSAR